MDANPMTRTVPSTPSTPESDPISPREQDPFARKLEQVGMAPLRRASVSTLQVNIGLRCNLACHHCHVESGPKRSEALDRRGCDRILELLEQNPKVETLDITGGAPEMHPEFRHLVAGARALGRRVIDRCNLTILFEPGQADTAEFLAEQRVDVIASLPCYSLENVEKQRGRGVFDGSIRGLQALNALGYGRRGGRGRADETESGLQLDLIYNPGGAFLPPSQESLEAEFRDRLGQEFGITFNRLLTITNMPIKRFAHELRRDGEYDSYMDLLVDHFNADNVSDLMCRSMISVGHDGSIWDCDFNQALELALPGSRQTIFDVDDLDALAGARIATASHCFGCTSGAGSSCGGALRST